MIKVEEVLKSVDFILKNLRIDSKTVRICLFIVTYSV